MQIPPKITLEAARINAGFSQRSAAHALGISLATYQNYESGKTSPSWHLVKKIEELFCYPIDFIRL